MTNKSLKSIDISSLDEDATTKVGIVFDEDTDEPTVGFIIKSKDSAEYRDTASALRAAAIKRQASKTQKIDRTTDEGAVKLDKVLQKNELELAIAVTVGFFGFTHEGKEVPFSPEMVRKLLTARTTWREAITSKLEEEESFLRLYTNNSSTSLEDSSNSTNEGKTESSSEQP